MISIIVSSYKEELFRLLEKNIKETIGQIPFEIIKIENHAKFGICTAYNIGGNRAQYPYLVFTHEDVMFHTNNWGNILVQTFLQNQTIGLLGVLGSKYKAYTYSGWTTGFETYMQMIHNADGAHFFSQKRAKKNIHINLNKEPLKQIFSYVPDKIQTEEVAAIDGIFMATKKSIFNKLKFDENLFKHFHCYDIDYSLQVIHADLKVAVSYNLVIEHFSSGSSDNNWIEATKLLHSKWRKSLPLYIIPLKRKQVYQAETNALRDFIKILAKNKELFEFQNIVNQIYKKDFLGVLNIWYWILFQKTLCFNLLKAYIKKYITDRIK